MQMCLPAHAAPTPTSIKKKGAAQRNTKQTHTHNLASDALLRYTIISSHMDLSDPKNTAKFVHFASLTGGESFRADFEASTLPRPAPRVGPPAPLTRATGSGVVVKQQMRAREVNLPPK